MDVRHLTRGRLLGVTARLLTGASVLVVVGLALVIRSAWQQIAEVYGPDGTATSVDVPFAQRATMVVFESSYRLITVPLLVASVLVVGAAVALDRHPSREQVGRLRWEVMGAGSLVLVVAGGLALANLYVLTGPDGATGGPQDYIGPQPLTEPIVINLVMLGATLLLLTVAALWWWGPAPAPEVDVELADQEEEPVDEVHTGGRPTPARGVSDAHRTPVDEATADYSRDWSPEDFRPPS